MKTEIIRIERQQDDVAHVLITVENNEAKSRTIYPLRGIHRNLSFYDSEGMEMTYDHFVLGHAPLKYELFIMQPWETITPIATMKVREAEGYTGIVVGRRHYKIIPGELYYMKFHCSTSVGAVASLLPFNWEMLQR